LASYCIVRDIHTAPEVTFGIRLTKIKKLSGPTCMGAVDCKCLLDRLGEFNAIFMGFLPTSVNVKPSKLEGHLS